MGRRQVARGFGAIGAVAGLVLTSCTSSPSEGGSAELASAGADVLGDADREVRASLPEAPGEQRETVAVTVGDVTLRGADEVPGPGLPAGSGTAEVVLFEDRNEVCVEIHVSDVDQPSAAHLHEGLPGEAGDVVLALPAPPDGDSSVDACVSAAPDVIRRLRDDRGRFYVNIHTAAAPDGALRGQLG